MSVTLYIPCYNAAEYLEECLAGVLRQTRSPDEILVVDDGSTDTTGEIATRYPVRLLRHGENRGLAAARNTALAAAQGEFVAALDADCVPAPDWLERLLRWFAAEEVVGAGGNLRERFTDALADEWRAFHLPQHFGDELLSDAPFLFGSNAVLRREAVLAVGGYDEQYRTNYEDVDLGVRLRARGGRLVYDPTARAEHLRRDTPGSALHACWRWYFFELSPPTNVAALWRRWERYWRRARYFALRSWQEGRFRLVPLDLLLGPYHCWLDWQYFWRTRQNRSP